MNVIKTELGQLLQERNERPERSAEIDRQIHERFARTSAVMVLDMSGFSRLTIQHGIVHFLAMIHRMSSIAVPVIEEYKGSLIKLEADNIFAVFPDVDVTVEACIDMMKRLAAANMMLPEEMDLYAKFGIGYGEILIVEGADINVEGRDMFGTEVNLASKLGEDLAERGEILLTEAAHARLAKGRETERVVMSISGLELVVHKIKTKAEAER
jgi:adenylate cyclase